MSINQDTSRTPIQTSGELSAVFGDNGKIQATFKFIGADKKEHIHTFEPIVALGGKDVDFSAFKKSASKDDLATLSKAVSVLYEKQLTAFVTQASVGKEFSLVDHTVTSRVSGNTAVDSRLEAKGNETIDTFIGSASKANTAMTDFLALARAANKASAEAEKSLGAGHKVEIRSASKTASSQTKNSVLSSTLSKIDVSGPLSNIAKVFRESLFTPKSTPSSNDEELQLTTQVFPELSVTTPSSSHKETEEVPTSHDYLDRLATDRSTEKPSGRPSDSRFVSELSSPIPQELTFNDQIKNISARIESDPTQNSLKEILKEINNLETAIFSKLNESSEQVLSGQSGALATHGKALKDLDVLKEKTNNLLRSATQPISGETDTEDYDEFEETPPVKDTPTSNRGELDMPKILSSLSVSSTYVEENDDYADDEFEPEEEVVAAAESVQLLQGNVITDISSNQIASPRDPQRDNDIMAAITKGIPSDPSLRSAHLASIETASATTKKIIEDALREIQGK